MSELRQWLDVRRAELLAALEVVDDALADLDGNERHEEPPPVPVDADEQPVPPPVLRVAQCRQGCTTWQEGEHRVCPTCGTGNPLYPVHLQPTDEDARGDELTAVLPGPRAVTLESVRDYVTSVHRGGARFSTHAAADYFNCSQGTVREHLEQLASLGTLKRELSFGSRGRWWSCPPVPNEQPTHRPRAALHIPGVDAERASDGRAVAHTGKPMGRSGKPGQDKRNANAGKRVAAK